MLTHAASEMLIRKCCERLKRGRMEVKSAVKEKFYDAFTVGVSTWKIPFESACKYLVTIFSVSE